MSNVIDLGDGHTLRFIGWHPDRAIPANRDRYHDIPDIERYGAIVAHFAPDGTPCEGFVTFDTPEVRALMQTWVVPPKPPLWTVEQWEPLTLSPSLLCSACGDHGFVRAGRWVRA